MVTVMRIKLIDFPQDVINAQRSGELVIFAGAGTSIDAPSNYPDFKGLAQQLGGNLYPRQTDEAIDRYLGRLVAAGVTVHADVKEILSSPESKPNAVHKALTGLCKTPAQLRIVT